ncbi:MULTISPECIES: hypothetical protein [Gammaproteobacteria]|jgi:hypothetical protein|uniref:hypothetical protein n=2 Tax=Pseudomonadota TaxID=1224 RepID=UPI001D17E560|nr:MULTISPECIES: hypothetical protein [Gammaproteobacteria]MCP0910920.1 hypothetical protein [Acinetobacter pseudolwoffii]
MRKTLVLWGGILATIMSTQNLSACEPHSPDEVFIARVQSFESGENQTKFQFSNHNFIFRPLMAWFRYSSPNEWNSDFKIKNIKKGSLIIGLAYPPDGNQARKYQVSSLALLQCKNDVISISKPSVPFLVWNREKGHCFYTDKSGLLNGFLEKDQTYYLHKIQAKYPTCRKLYSAFPMT